jgi:hypothetical protein
MRPLSKMLAVVALVLAVLPAAAAARDCDHDGVPVTYPAPQPVPAPAPGWYAGHRPWRDASWRERELAGIRAEMRELDARRAEFHARWAGRPGKIRKFERWYASRRAELDRRYWELQRYAWR